MANSGEQTRPAIVVGGGPAGLAATLALSAAGMPVALVDAGGDPAEDKRTFALMSASVELLHRLSVWQACVEHASPLRRLRLIDDTRRLLRAPSVEFDAGEIGEREFGWNIPHAALVFAMRDRIRTAANVERIVARFERIEAGADAVSVVLEDGRQLAASLVVAADGRRSPGRAAAGIRVDEWQYDQAAIVTTMRHSRPHDDVSTEFHRPSGPFTLVPLPGNRSSLVWVETRRVAETYELFDDGALALEIEHLSHRILGTIEIDGPRAVFPLSGLNARRYAASRIALVGEAAHIMPPIGAQGLNLGLRDAAAIAEIAGDVWTAGRDIGGADVMSAYDRARRVDVITRTSAVDVLNRTLLTDFVPFHAARALGLMAVGRIGPLRRFVMREGVAPQAGLPRLMRRDPSVPAI